MMIRKHLLTSLITVLGLLRLVAQDPINVYGVVTNANGSTEAGVSITVSAFYADSTFFQENVFTGVYGDYQVAVPNPDPNQFAFIQVDMVDCNNTIQTQYITIANGSPPSFEANFTYCANSSPDSCLVYILIENTPGSNQVQLTAWTPPGQNVEYLWSTGETTQTIIPTTSGPYAVFATFPDLNCTVGDSVWVSLDSLGFCYVYIVATINPDSSTFNLEAVPTGLAPYTYLWSTGETTSIITNVAAGTYCVDVIDALGCLFTNCILVGNNSFCEAYISTDPSGGLTVYPYGTAPFSYQWNTGETTQSIFPQIEGLYCVTVTDATGCEAYSCYDYGWFPMDSCYVFVNAYMQDSNIFVLQAIASGWGQPISYLWSTGETTESIYPQDPFQTYCVTVVDDVGCTSTGCYEPNNWCYAWVDLQYLDTTTAVLTAFSDPIFNWPGLPEPTYVWSTGETTESITVDTSGTYCVTVTLGSGCVTEACAYVDFESLSTSCSAWVVAYPDSNSNQWYAEVYAWGFGDFTYLWHNGDTTPVIAISHPQAYACVTVTSSLGCETVACLDSFYSPCTPWVDIFYDTDSSATLTAWAWNDPAQNGTYTWSNGQSGQSITVFQEGQYCVTASAGGCQGVTCVDVYFQNVENCGVYITQTDTSFGTIFFANAWGTPPFLYEWDNGSADPYIIVDFGSLEHCVTITDANGCSSAACNYFLDSCYAEIILTYAPDAQLCIYAWDPIVSVVWSTGVGDSSLCLPISEPGTYCATYITLNGCVGTTCIKIDTLIPGNPAGIINGFVFNDTHTQVFGDARAYKLNNNSGEVYQLAGSAAIGPDGFYAIGGLEPGIYIVKAEPGPNTPTSESYIPTYHSSSTSWELADPIVVPSMLPVTNDIALIKQIPGGGPGLIGGVIADPGHFTAEAGDVRGEGGLGNIVILLADQYGQTLDYTRSLEDGSYRFTDLALGTYRLKFDIPGIISQEVWVTLTQNEPEIGQVNFLIENTVAVKDPKAEQISLYPNPATTTVHMAVPGDNIPYDIQVVDVTGKVVFAGSARNYNSILSIDVSALSHGLYQVNLVSNSRLFYGRFVRQE